MFSKNKPTKQPENAKPTPTKQGIPSILSADMRMVGNIHSDGTLDIDGSIEGNVKCQSATIRKHGHVKGDVIAETIHVYGKVQGQIKARNVQFFKGCKAEGVIVHESITIEDGAFVDGRFKRVETVELDEDFVQPETENNDAFPAFSSMLEENDDSEEDTSDDVTSPLFFSEDDEVSDKPEASGKEEVSKKTPVETKAKAIPTQEGEDDAAADNLKPAQPRKKPEVKVLENLRLISDVS